MKFTYTKNVAPLLESTVGEPEANHRWFLDDDGDFFIEASVHGVRFKGTSGWFQPVNEEMKIPEDFREFLVRLSSAFEQAWKEQEKERKAVEARRMILGAK